MSQPSEEPPLSGSPSDDSFTTHLTSFRVNNMVARPRVGRSGSRSGLGTGIASNSPRNSVDQPSLSTAAAGSPPTSSSDSPILSSRNSVDSSVASAPEPKSSPPISIDEVSSKRASCVSKTPSTPIIAIERFSDAFWKGWLRKKRVGTMGIKRRYVVVKPHRIEYYKDPSDTEPAGTIEFNNIGIGFDEKFTVISTRGIFEFAVESPEDHFQWTVVLSNALTSINK